MSYSSIIYRSVWLVSRSPRWYCKYDMMLKSRDINNRGLREISYDSDNVVSTPRLTNEKRKKICLRGVVEIRGSVDWYHSAVKGEGEA